MKSVVTENLERIITPEQLRMIVMSFHYLYRANPKERHFSIKFCNEDDG